MTHNASNNFPPPPNNDGTPYNGAPYNFIPLPEQARAFVGVGEGAPTVIPDAAFYHPAPEGCPAILSAN